MELELVNVANVKISSSNVVITAPCGLSGISRYQEKAIQHDLVKRGGISPCPCICWLIFMLATADRIFAPQHFS